MVKCSRIFAVCLLFGTMFPVGRALAYELSTDISYSTSSGDLSGYSRTRKEPWEYDIEQYCLQWGWDDYYGWYCEWGEVYQYYAYVWAGIYTPSSSLYSSAAVLAWHDAFASYTLTPPTGGVWTGSGEHYVYTLYYQYLCEPPYLGGGCYPIYWIDWYSHLGSTSDQADVPTKILFEISRYSTSSLTESEVDSSILPSATEVLQTNDGGVDVSCPIIFERSGAISVFTISDGVVSDQAELEAIMEAPGRVQVVNEINWCGNADLPPGATIVGCSSGLGMTVRRTASLEGILWAHEYGHNQDLWLSITGGHLTDPTRVGYGLLVSTARRVSQFECNVMRNPLN